MLQPTNASYFRKLNNFLLRILITSFIFIGGFFIMSALCKPISSSDADPSFESFTTKLFQDELSASTLSLYYTLENPVASGYKDCPITFGTFQTNALDSSFSIENLYAQLSMHPYEKLSAKNQLTYDILLDTLARNQEGTPYILYEEPLTPYTGLHCQLPVLLAEFPLNTENDITVYLSLLKTLPDYFDSLLTFEKAKAETGLFMSDASLDSVLVDCKGFVDMEENYMLSTFQQRIGMIENLSTDLQTSYCEENADIFNSYVIPAYKTLMSGLEEFRGYGTNNAGLCYFSGGQSYYAHLIQSNTGSSRSIPEIQSLIKTYILDDLYDLDEAISAANNIPHSNSEKTSSTLNESIYDVEQYFQQYSSTEDILLDLEQDMKYAFPAPPQVSYTIKDVPTELEPYLSPAFYLIPPMDNTTENTIYINNAHMSDCVNLYTTLAHEGYPGHLYQTTYFANTNPDPIRNILNYGGYAEGWATYTEMCSYYMSDLPSPQNTMLQKNAALTLGLYAYADIGIHCDGWNLEKTKEFFALYGFDNALTIERIYELIVATPTNYLKYYLGYVEFLELKMKCIKEWGTEFSQVRFHTAVLDVGPAPFDVLEKYILEK